MLDRFIFTFTEQPLAKIAARLGRTGITADQVTCAGFVVGLAAVPLLAANLFFPALTAIVLNRILDGLDGSIARLRWPSDRGAFIDIAFDFFFYGSIPFGFALADPGANALPAALLLFSFIGTGSSFLALAALAHKHGVENAALPHKGIYYLGGLAEGTETALCFALMCIFPDKFPLIACVFAVVCFLTTIFRWFWGWRILSR